MGILEQIMQLKNQGFADEQIVRSLQQQGISPRQINDALSQAQIKSALSSDSSMEGMEPSIMQQEHYAPATQEIQEGEEMYEPQYQEEIAPIAQQEFYQPQEYSEYEQYTPTSGGFDTETIIEISEQVFSEKISKLIEQTQEINEFKTLAQIKIENIETRLRKIESIIDNLQVAILEKIGSYGQNLESIKKEMSMMQDSFGKMVNPILQHAKKHEEKPHTPTAKKTKKS